MNEVISSTLKSSSVNGLLPESVSQSLFDNAFKRSYSVEYIFNTDIEELKKKMKTPKPGQKPLLVIIWPEMLMSRYINEFSGAIKEYGEMFETYYIGDPSKVEHLLFTKTMPKELP